MVIPPYTESGEVRLVGGTSDCNGRLEMNHQGEWRLVSAWFDCHLVVRDHRLRLCDLCQGGNSWPCALLKPVDDVISLPASCKKMRAIFTVAAATSHFLLHKGNAYQDLTGFI